MLGVNGVVCVCVCTFWSAVRSMGHSVCVTYGSLCYAIKAVCVCVCFRATKFTGNVFSSRRLWLSGEVFRSKQES